MERSVIKRITRDRLRTWTKDLVAAHATPAVLIGIGHDHKSGQLSVVTCEEFSRDDIIVLLDSAADLLLK